MVMLYATTFHRSHQVRTALLLLHVQGSSVNAFTLPPACMTWHVSIYYNKDVARGVRGFAKSLFTEISNLQIKFFPIGGEPT